MPKQLSNTIKTVDVKDEKYSKLSNDQYKYNRNKKYNDYKNKALDKKNNPKSSSKSIDTKNENYSNISENHKISNFSYKSDEKKSKYHNDVESELVQIAEYEKKLRDQISKMNTSYLEVIRLAPAAVRKKLLLEKNGELIEDIYKRQVADLQAQRDAEVEKEIILAANSSKNNEGYIGTATLVPTGTLDNILKKGKSALAYKSPKVSYDANKNRVEYKQKETENVKIDEEASASFKALIESVYRETLAEKELNSQEN